MHLMTDEKEGALSGWLGLKYRLHTSICYACRRCRRQYEESVKLAREIPREEVSSSVEEGALSAFRARGRR